MVRKENSCVAVVVVVLAFLTGGGSLRAASPTPVRSPDKAGHALPIEQNHDQGRLLEAVEQQPNKPRPNPTCRCDMPGRSCAAIPRQ